MAILEYAHEEEAMRRHELLIGQDPTNKQVFAEQISIRMQVNREYHLLPIYEAIFHSGDPELKNVTKKHHLLELSWLRKRLVDIYGEDAKPYASDGAVIMHGIIQHMMHAWSSTSKEKVNIDKLITFTINRLDSIMTNMIETKEVFLGDQVMFAHIKEPPQHTPTKKQLLEQLDELQQAVANKVDEENIQYIQFLIQELQTETPRLYILKTVLQSFRKAFIGVPYEVKARNLAHNIWTYIIK